MELSLKRFSSQSDDTLGVLSIGGTLECFTLEDEFREVKVPGETRIPAMRFEIVLRDEGGMNERYTRKYPYHQGMLWLKNVPNFEYVYIHIGNDEGQTAGCILVGDGVYTNVVRNGALLRSEIAYERLYKKIIDAMERGERVWITISDSKL